METPSLLFLIVTAEVFQFRAHFMGRSPTGILFSLKKRIGSCLFVFLPIVS